MLAAILVDVDRSDADLLAGGLAVGRADAAGTAWDRYRGWRPRAAGMVALSDARLADQT